MQQDATSSKGEEFSIQQLATLSGEGGIRVPEFQRSFRWDGTDVLALFDSIFRGYPVGSVLLWRKPAPAKRVTLGALTLSAPKRSDALWVVDGQQRITSFINGVSAEAGAIDERFRLVYALENRKFMRANDARNALAVPLPVLFDIAKLFDWLQQHPEAREYASDMQAVTGRLRDFKLPASVVEQADESVLRDIFDRMNTAGKKLRSAEIFDAIHRANGETSADDLSISAIADRLESSTTFGRIEDAAIYQAVLVRRHPDITRDPHGEFDPERRSVSDFPGEGLDEGYRGAERALERAVAFLTDQAGVPHVTFLPYRFLLLVLSRYFALYPEPSPRNLELLARWFWGAAARASELNLNGSTATVRSLSGLIVTGDESGSVQRLLESVASEKALPLPDTTLFRANRAASRIVLCALWARAPRDIRTGAPLEAIKLADTLEGRDTPTDVSVEIVRRSNLDDGHRSSAGNRLLAVVDDEIRLMDYLLSQAGSNDTGADEILDSHLITRAGIQELLLKDWTTFIESRELAVKTHVELFLRAKTGFGFEATPPLDEFDFDRDDLLEEFADLDIT